MAESVRVKAPEVVTQLEMEALLMAAFIPIMETATAIEQARSFIKAYCLLPVLLHPHLLLLRLPLLPLLDNPSALLKKMAAVVTGVEMYWPPLVLEMDSLVVVATLLMETAAEEIINKEAVVVVVAVLLQ